MKAIVFTLFAFWLTLPLASTETNRSGSKGGVSLNLKALVGFQIEDMLLAEEDGSAVAYLLLSKRGTDPKSVATNVSKEIPGSRLNAHPITYWVTGKASEKKVSVQIGWGAASLERAESFKPSAKKTGIVKCFLSYR